MEVTIKLFKGPYHSDCVCKADMQKNIDAFVRLREGRSLAGDGGVLRDTQTILEEIRDKLPALMEQPRRQSSLEKCLKVGTHIRLGPRYCASRKPFKAGQVIELVDGSFESDSSMGG